MVLFQKKFRTKTTRLKDYDYSQEGVYFVTICTKEKKECFGNIINGTIQLSKIGIIAKKFWQEIPNHFPFVLLDEYFVMPNHIHGIIIINHERGEQKRRDEALPRLYNGKHVNLSRISPYAGSLSVIIGSYKSICTKKINLINSKLNFKWQPRFYDHIIRNEPALNKIREYIFVNPQNWEQDRNNPENLSLPKK